MSANGTNNYTSKKCATTRTSTTFSNGMSKSERLTFVASSSLMLE